MEESKGKAEFSVFKGGLSASWELSPDSEVVTNLGEIGTKG